MMDQPRPLGRVGRFSAENLPVTQRAVPLQVRTVKVLPATGTKPLISVTLSVPLSCAEPVVGPVI